MGDENDVKSVSCERYTLTRAEVAARLGVSPTSVRRMEFDQLHPVSDDRGVWRFDPAELDAVSRVPVARRRRPLSEDARARAKDGKLAARVFQMFARSWSLPRIVVATKEPPERIRALYHEWSTSLEECEWDASGR
jgi:hypothetical protein